MGFWSLIESHNKQNINMVVQLQFGNQTSELALHQIIKKPSEFELTRVVCKLLHKSLRKLIILHDWWCQHKDKGTDNRQFTRAQFKFTYPSHFILQAGTTCQANSLLKNKIITHPIQILELLQSPLAQPPQPQCTHSMTFSSRKCFGTRQTQVVWKLWSRGCMHLRQQSLS